jgi:MFS family permease
MSTSMIFTSKAAVPAEHKRNFWHLYLDIMWFGVLNGSAIAFAAVFATRQGANSFQIGLLSAAPAITTLFFALPAGQLLQKHSINRSVFWTSVAHRMFYGVWILMPVILLPSQQVWLLIATTFLMSIPGTALAIGFNGLFAATVPPEWRPYVAGRRNAVFALSSILISFIVGWLLENLSFVLGYQIVFTIGLVGAMMSSVHLWFIKPLQEELPPLNIRQRLNDWAQPGLQKVWMGMRQTIALRSLTRGVGWRKILQIEVLDGRFRHVLFILFFFHLSQYIVIPVFPIYTVKTLGLSDQLLSWGNMVFYIALFFGSMQLARISGWLGNQRTLAIGITLMSLYPFTMALVTPQTTWLYFVVSLIGGVAWTLAGGAIANYLLDHVPDENRAPYLAWYNLALHAAILGGSLIGPAIGENIGLREALYVGAGLRLFSGALLWRWG